MLGQAPYKITVASENALIVYFDGENLNQKNQFVSQLTEILVNLKLDWLDSIIPAYHSVLITIDLEQTDYFAVKQRVTEVVKALFCKDVTPDDQTLTDSIIEIPVCYGLGDDNDLQRVAKHNQLSVQQVIHLHQHASYRVFCLGFAPGFAFLGETDEKISTPRLDTPRKKVPKGAVAIADRQTAIYPNSSPGGWNLIGLCPLTLFDPDKSPPIPFKIGDTVKFKSISEAEYMRLVESKI
ncbi:5-oxoprolinase subunit PxpB [Aliiglaciecola lipolytica]|uniref:Carboxyltransferase domain-containing protein n=1 Tax=Aliiglaciecola lipolytica E3 TaxID=1127673 RepID=K6X1S3_9ALTE|nr:5-oxoprolinase subunit PxpB [Aliiglaciecola lipolytica]GAC14609.1 hypothetical protein GLIP_1981 [Aliiglaciecola lipolytica E3]